MRALPETLRLLDGLLKFTIGDVRVRPARHSQVRATEKLLNGLSGALQQSGSALPSATRKLFDLAHPDLSEDPASTIVLLLDIVAQGLLLIVLGEAIYRTEIA